MRPHRVLIAGGGTGGHLVPALNIAAGLRRAEPDVSLLLVGARRGLEAEVLPGAGLPYRLLPMQPLYRSRPWRNVRLLYTAPAVLGGLASIFRSFDPHAVVGTGGYASGPALALGVASGRFTALQEQNADPGLVTRWMAGRVRQLHLGFPEARRALRCGPRTAVHEFGNPVNVVPAPDPLPDLPAPPRRVIAVIGGSQGAHGLNELLLRDLESTTEWPGEAFLLWIAGPSHRERVAERVAATLFAPRIRVVPFVPALASHLARLTLAISRAGAMLCSELAAAGVPAIFVPFPGAAAGHQSRNAKALEAAGAAVRIEEATVPSGALWDRVLGLLRNEDALERMRAAMRARGRPDAADRIAVELLAGLEPGDDGRGDG
ncbi:MAG: glycosyltransferase [Gemmatimonadota bacterium]